MNTIGTVLGAYLLFIGAVFIMQRSLLYPASREAPDPNQAGVPGLQVVRTETADGLSLTHWYRPPEQPEAPVVVVFHGNAGHFGDRVPKLAALLQAGFGMLFAGYRGYGGNPGHPTEENLTADARVLLDWLAGQGVKPARTVLYGESLGTGIAVKMAAERKVGAVVLEAPYTSIAEVAQLHYWYLPARWMILDKWNSMDYVGRLGAPLLVVHGARDRTIPPRYSRRLFDAAPEPKEYFLLEEGDHNTLYESSQVPEKVIEFIHRHIPAAG